MKSFSIMAAMLLAGVCSFAQVKNNLKDHPRTIEVAAYASQDVLPNAIYISFVLKEYIEQGKVVTIEHSEKEIKEIIKKIGCDTNDLFIGNLYGYTMVDEKGESYFNHKIQYTLKLNNLECVHLFMNDVNKKGLESFNIDEFDFQKSEEVIRALQIRAYKNAKLKADAFLKVYNEECGRLVEIQEINGVFTYPSADGRGAIKKSVKENAGLSFQESVFSSSKYIKLEYMAKVVFEIK